MHINFAMWRKASCQLIKMDDKKEWDSIDVRVDFLAIQPGHGAASFADFVGGDDFLFLAIQAAAAQETGITVRDLTSLHAAMEPHLNRLTREHRSGCCEAGERGFWSLISASGYFPTESAGLVPPVHFRFDTESVAPRAAFGHIDVSAWTSRGSRCTRRWRNIRKFSTGFTRTWSKPAKRAVCWI